MDTAFHLPERLSAKADPALTAADDAHLAAIARTLEESVASLERQISTLLQETDRAGQGAMDRDLEVHRLSARVRALRRHGLDLCLGRLVPDDGGPPVYIGRLGLTGSDGERLLVDWRTPAAEPFFGATHARPMGLVSRRRFRWTRGRISDYWDEVFTADALEGHAALDDQSAFIASLGSSRSSQMHDVLGTIQADQDAIIRAGSRGALVVDGGPGTGKTVVALHRTAYLLHADPRLHRSRGGVLVVGPHQPYLAYVADVLPSLGEEGVQTCTVADLVTEGDVACPDADPEVARLKASLALVAAIEPAVRWYEEPPTEPLVVTTDAGDLTVTVAAWAEAFDAPDPGTPHNEGRGVVWEALLDLLTDQVEPPAPDEDDDPDAVDPLPGIRRSLAHDRGLLTAFNRAWPLLEAADLVGDLWSVPAFLRMCAPSLTPEEVRALQRPEPQAWTTSDLPLLDAARHLLGDPEAVRRRRRQVAAAAAERERMDRIADDLVDSDDDGEGAITMLRGEDVRDALVDQDHVTRLDPDLLAGPFAHVVVDEAQELTDAQWQMLLRRCPSRSLTVVGDRAQARHGFSETWEQRLARLGLTDVTVSSLAINYRTPQEVMVEAEPVIRAVLPDANVPTSVRSSGLPVVHGSVADLTSALTTWLDAHAEGRACVIAAPGTDVTLPSSTRVRSLTPELAKGLEFDLVVLLDPERFGTGIEGAVDRYVAMTRATQQLVVLTCA